MDKSEPEYLLCEHKSVYLLLISAAGMMGAYTFSLRGGVFCNAQTANFVMMSLAFGRGDLAGGFYYFIPFLAYFSGAMFSELLAGPVKRFHLLRWDSYFVAFEALVLFIIGFIPLSVPHRVVQVIINFIASMQYNTYRAAEGIPMATTFCTNHVRQSGIAFARFLHKKDPAFLRRMLFHLAMIFSFSLGAFLVALLAPLVGAKSIWLALLPLLVALFRLARADLTSERELLESKPHGH